MTIKRRVLGAPEWGTLATKVSAWYFIDSQVEAGSRYEYLLEADERDYRAASNSPRSLPVESKYDRYLEVAVEAPPIHERGSILLIVDETLLPAPDISRALTTLRLDLAMEGWRVIPPVSGPRHDDADWANNVQKIRRLTNLVFRVSQRRSDLSCIYLIGHVVYPMSGNQRPDGNHHTRPFPVDMYYGDTDRAAGDWPDTVKHHALPDIRSRYRDLPANSPGDGKFDPSRYPSVIEVPVGRVDFALLEPFQKTQRADERALIVRYLNKAHRFRTGELDFGEDVSAYSSLPYSTANLRFRLESTGAAQHAFDCLRAWSADPDAALQHKSLFKPVFPGDVSNRYLLSRESGSGAYGGINMGSRFQWTTSDVAARDAQRYAGIVILYGSFLGEWQKPGSLMRALLAQPDSTLAVLWMMTKQDERSLQPMGCGRSIGECWARFLSTLDQRDRDYHRAGSQSYSGSVQYSLLGDPTLQLHRPHPPRSLEAKRDRTSVRLAWQSSGQGEQAYYVYLSTSGVEGPYELLNGGAAISDQHYVDPNPPAGPKVYRVRASHRYVSGSGTFAMLSRGVTVAVD
jgi:hypothetical protein